MYEVRWTLTLGRKGHKSFENLGEARNLYESFEGDEGVISVGIYHNEKEMATWSR